MMNKKYRRVCIQNDENEKCLLENEKQPARCFVCDEIVEGVQTSIVLNTKLDIPAKLSQLVGEEYAVIISEEDCLCNLCYGLIEHMDDLQKCLDGIASTLSNHLNKKYGLTDESSLQQVNNENKTKEMEFEVHHCTMCSFSSTQKPIFDNHIRTHVLDNIKVSNNDIAQSLKVFKCGACSKTYSKKEDCIRHMELKHKSDKSLDDVGFELKPANGVETNTYEEKEDKLHTCNNCFLTFVDESFLAEHDCCQDSDQDIGEFYLKEDENQTLQSQRDCKIDIKAENIINEQLNTNYIETNNQNNINIKLNTLLEEVGSEPHCNYQIDESNHLQVYEDLLMVEAEQLLDNDVTSSCSEMFPLAEKLNENCQVEESAEKMTRNESAVDEHGVDNVEEETIGNEIKLISGNLENTKKKKVYVCGKCNFRTNLPLDLKAHFLVHLEQNINNKSDRKFVCSICNTTFERAGRFQKHMKGHENSTGPLNCSYCGVQVQDKLHLRNHNLQNHSLVFKKPLCDLCNESFRTLRLLKKHKDLKHRGNLIYKCEICDKSFKQRIQLKNHLEYAHRSSPKCRFCDKTIENLKKLREHEYRHMRLDSKKFQCDICSRVFKTHSGLRFHMLRHSGKYPYFCEICGHGFVSIKMLEEHSGVHTKEDRYMCDICGKMFCFYSSYMIHRKWHDNPLPYKCNICNQKFHHTSVLAVHKRRVHTGERPYKCPYCALSFVISSTYKKHLCLHTQEFPYNCNNCNRGFTTRKKYAIHLAKTHGDYSILNQGPKKCEYKMSLRKNE